MKDNSQNQDFELVNQAINGDKEALKILVNKHYDFIYNVALKMVFYKQDALDITQDVMIKVITNLSQFKENNSFKGWLYRITKNHFLTMKERAMEVSVTGFDQYGKGLDYIQNENLAVADAIEKSLIVEEIKISCTTGMLMCLSREQRLIYIFGEIFEIDHNLGAYIFETTKENYRKILSRTRADLQNFMNDKCGLLNPKNSCRCKKKANGFIKQGWVDPNNKVFTKEYSRIIKEKVPNKMKSLEELVPKLSKDIYQLHPFYTPENKHKLLDDLLMN